MSVIARLWKNISIAKKLYFVVGIMAVLICGELLTLRFAMVTLSAVRAFVGGEGLWSKAQKNSAFKLQRYGVTRNEFDFAIFLDYLKVPEGDHRARIELEKANPDMAIVRQGFLDGKIHPDDIEPMVTLLRRFYWVSYLDRAIQIWGKADDLLVQFKQAGLDYCAALGAQKPDKKRIEELLGTINSLNEALTKVEEDFSSALGEGSRWLEGVVIFLIFLAVLTVESIGLTLTFFTSRQISRGLADLNKVAQRIGRGDFGHALPVRSNDEIGSLTTAVNQMGYLLKKSYGELEARVRERTMEIAGMAEENAVLYKSAKAALVMRDEFLATASHELRSPLTALYMQLQVMQRCFETTEKCNLEKAAEMAGRSLRQAKRLTILVDELMDLTYLSRGKLNLKIERCDIAAIASDAASQLSADAARAGCDITIDAGRSVFGHFDQTRIHQVITNLISNAVKYGPGKPIGITVQQVGQNVSVVVIDKGPGIAASQLEQIFKRFERVTNDASISGLGLGLYISRQIVEAHKGTLSVSSELGAGTTFTVKLAIMEKEQPS